MDAEKLLLQQRVDALEKRVGRLEVKVITATPPIALQDRVAAARGVERRNVKKDGADV